MNPNPKLTMLNGKLTPTYSTLKDSPSFQLGMVAATARQQHWPAAMAEHDL
jgi:hypothetical protein